MPGPGSPPYCRCKMLRIHTPTASKSEAVLDGGLGFSPAASILWSGHLQASLARHGGGCSAQISVQFLLLSSPTGPLHRGLHVAGDAGSKRAPATSRMGTPLMSSLQEGWAMPLPSGRCAGALGTSFQQICAPGTLHADGGTIPTRPEPKGAMEFPHRHGTGKPPLEIPAITGGSEALVQPCR